jgi:hypothetical protein
MRKRLSVLAIVTVMVASSCSLFERQLVERWKAADNSGGAEQVVNHHVHAAPERMASDKPYLMEDTLQALVKHVETLEWLKAQDPSPGWTGQCEQHHRLFVDVGFPREVLGTVDQVCWGESRGSPTADNGWCCHGLFQIHQGWLSWNPTMMAAQGAYSVSDLYDPVVNSRVALQISKGGWSWSPWSAWDGRGRRPGGFSPPGLPVRHERRSWPRGRWR